MKYKIGRKYFDTLESARGYADEYMEKNKIVLAILPVKERPKQHNRRNK